MKGFSERERERIEEGLVRAGKEQFSTFGHDRTRIKDLTEEVGIAASTFYQFFDSKEALYREIRGRDRERVAEEVEAVLNAAPDQESEIRAGLQFFFEELESNRLYYRLVVENDIESIHRNVPDDRLEAFYREQSTVYEPYARRWTAEESFRIDEPAVLIGLLRLLSFTIAAKDRFGDIEDSELDGAQEALLETLVDGLLIE